jgi:ADP-heptose:LPS heptosyltransferase
MPPKNILIFPRPHVGDFIWATSAVALLKKNNTPSTINVVIADNLIELTANNPVFDKYYTYDLSLFESSNIFIKIFYRLFLFFKLFFLLRRKNFEICFLFSPFALFIKLSVFLKVKKIVYSVYECCGNRAISLEQTILGRFVNKNKLFPIEINGNLDRIHRSEIYQSLVRRYENLENMSLPYIPSYYGNTHKIISLLQTDKKYKIAICMQPSKASKNIWSKKYFVQTISELSKKFSASFFIVGTKEKNDNSFNSLKIKLPSDTEIYNLCGKTSLLELKELLNNCDLLISVDTGTIHIAATTKINIISIFGVTHPDAVAPMTHRNTPLYAGVKCSPCIYKLTFEKKKCPYGDNPKCMETVKPEEAIKAAVKILTKINGGL